MAGGISAKLKGTSFQVELLLDGLSPTERDHLILSSMRGKYIDFHRTQGGDSLIDVSAQPRDRAKTPFF